MWWSGDDGCSQCTGARVVDGVGEIVAVSRFLGVEKNVQVDLEWLRRVEFGLVHSVGPEDPKTTNLDAIAFHWILYEVRFL